MAFSGGADVSRPCWPGPHGSCCSVDQPDSHEVPDSIGASWLGAGAIRLGGEASLLPVLLFTLGCTHASASPRLARLARPSARDVRGSDTCRATSMADLCIDQRDYGGTVSRSRKTVIEASIEGAKFLTELMESTVEIGPELIAKNINDTFLRLWDAPQDMQLCLSALGSQAVNVLQMLQLVNMCKIAGMERGEAESYINDLSKATNASSN